MGHRRARDERCGSKATNDLDAFVDRRPVSCVPFSLDQYGRTVASCAVGDADLGEWLVRNGLDLPRLGLPPSAFSFTAPSIRRGMSENRSRHLSSRGAAGAPSARAGLVRRVMIPKSERPLHHSAAIADSAIATSTKVSEKVGARPRSAKADGLRAFTVAPVRLRLRQ